MTHKTIDSTKRDFLAAVSRLTLAAGLSALPWQLHAGPKFSPRIKLLLDTDIGSDIDDAVALAYLLQQPEVELLGITTVTGESRKRSALATYLVNQSTQHLPVLSGTEVPRVIQQRQATAPQALKLPAHILTTLPASHDPEQAIDYLANVIRANPGEITLLAVGPFTNVARLFEREPDVSSLLKELVIMGGKYSDFPTPWGPTEWNAIVDPQATDLMFQTAQCPIRAFGLDITWQLYMTPNEVRNQFALHPLLETVLAWSEVWFAKRDLLHFHDPLAAACLVDPDICNYVQGIVTVDLKSTKTAGITTFEANPHGNVRIASGVNPARFFSTFFAPFRR
jgi:purine nucleosidase